jgi:death-on-curing protein
LTEPCFLDIEEVLDLHERQVEAFGGALGIRDHGLLESAIAMPRASFGGQFDHESIFEMAAAYAFHIAENQPFLDGNKRTGLGAALVFLRINGFKVVDPEETLYAAMIAIAERRLDKAGLAALLERLSRPVGDEGALRSS